MMNSAPLSAIPVPLPPDLTVEKFKPHVGETFQFLLGEGQSEPLELLSATETPRSARPGHRMPFSLIFRASSRQFYVPQGIFPLEHSQVGRLDLFMVPVGPDDAGMLFQAVFN